MTKPQYTVDSLFPRGSSTVWVALVHLFSSCFFFVFRISCAFTFSPLALLATLAFLLSVEVFVEVFVYVSRFNVGGCHVSTWEGMTFQRGRVATVEIVINVTPSQTIEFFADRKA